MHQDPLAIASEHFMEKDVLLESETTFTVCVHSFAAGDMPCLGQGLGVKREIRQSHKPV